MWTCWRWSCINGLNMDVELYATSSEAPPPKHISRNSQRLKGIMCPYYITRVCIVGGATYKVFRTGICRTASRYYALAFVYP